MGKKKLKALIDMPGLKNEPEFAAVVEPTGERKRGRAHGARAPPTIRLLDRHEVCAVAGVSYPTIWAWMREGKFPRGRTVGSGRVRWRSDEINAWLDGLPPSRLKGAAS